MAGKIVYVIAPPRKPHVYHTSMECLSLRRGFIVVKLRGDGRVALGSRGPVVRLAPCSKCTTQDDA